MFNLKNFQVAKFWQFHPLYIVYGFCQKWPKIDPMNLLHYLKELTLSFQESIKSLKSDTPNKSLAIQRSPEHIALIYIVCITL